jgi:hypothetical protein
VQLFSKTDILTPYFLISPLFLFLI